MSLIPGSDSITQIISLLSYVFFIVLIFYGQRIQMYVMIREVENSLHKLRHIKEEGRKTAIETLKEIGKPTDDPSATRRPLPRILYNRTPKHGSCRDREQA